MFYLKILIEIDKLLRCNKESLLITKYNCHFKPIKILCKFIVIHLIIFQEKLLMDTKYVYPITFPFHPSNIRLDDIEVSEILNLSMLKKI